RVGDQFQAATSNDGGTYTLVPGTTMDVPMPAAIMEGMALSSGTQGIRDTVAYAAVNIQSPGTPPNPPAPPTPCPGGWSCSDIGNPALVGDQSLSGGTWTLKGAGNDINGNADQFHYVWRSLAANGIIVQYRATQGLKTQIVSGPTGTAPTYLMIARSSNIYCTYTSSDGANWS